ncbi:MAG: hypothetical protein KF703_07015 [Actinobacteria bacterium]|nr:hypothetical protein [Actinomycetota bacterium]
MPAHVLYHHWGFVEPVDRMEWVVDVRVDPGTRVGEYLALLSGSIDGSACYLGLQTDVSDPSAGRGVGKGLIFSTWWSFDDADLRIAPGGFCERGTHEGRFIGVRNTFDWGVGSYRVSLARAGADRADGREFDWFELTIAEDGPHGGGAATLIGALRFPRRRSGIPARVDPGGILFMEVYAGAATWRDVARWDVDVTALGDGRPCPSGRTEYPSFPHGQRMPNCNIRVDTASGQVELQTDAGVSRIDRPRSW